MNYVRSATGWLAAALLVLGSALVAFPGPAQAADYTTSDGAGYSGPTTVVWGSTIRVEGTGWKHPDGSGSAIVAKLDAAPGNAGVLTTRAVADPVNGGNFADKTVHAAVVADADGNWRMDIPFPKSTNASVDWLPEETHLVRLLSGSLKGGDTGRSAAVEFKVTAPTNTCTDTNGTATASSPTADIGGTVRVTGTGWCHPAEGASRIAVKIDDGAHSRVSGILEGNATIWAIIEPDPATGEFDVEITVPDGTLATSKDADGKPFGEGGHWFNLLTGSLKPGDVGRSVKVDFTVGAYKPQGAPDPLGDDELTAGSRGGVTVTRTAAALKVKVPGTAKGDWVHLDVYSSGAPRALWGGTKWFQVGAGGIVTAPLKGITLPVGSNKLTVQSGSQGEVGKLIGWAPLKVAAANAGSSNTSGNNSSGNSGNNSGGNAGNSAGSTGASPAVTPVVTNASAPATAPEAPVATMDELDSSNAGEVTSVIDETNLAVTVEGGVAGQWIHVWLYDADGSAALGWVQLDAEGRFVVDVSALGGVRFKLALQGEDGSLVGWTGAGTDIPTTSGSSAVVTAVAQAVAAPATGDDGITSTTLLNIGLSGLGVLSLVVTAAALTAGRPTGKVAP